MSNVKTQFIVRACGLLRHLYTPSRERLDYIDVSADSIRCLCFYNSAGFANRSVYIFWVDCNKSPRYYLLYDHDFYDDPARDKLVRYATRLKEVNYEQVSNS